MRKTSPPRAFVNRTALIAEPPTRQPILLAEVALDAAVVTTACRRLQARSIGAVARALVR